MSDSGIAIVFHPEVDFCVWSLQKDGMRYPPFESHDDGGHELRDRGLTGTIWYDWLLQVTSTVLAGDARTKPAKFVEDLLNHPWLMMPNDKVRAHLSDMWPVYQKTVSDPMMALQSLMNLHQALGELTRRDDRLLVMLVRYPRPLLLEIAQTAVVLGCSLEGCDMAAPLLMSYLVRTQPP